MVLDLCLRVFVVYHLEVLTQLWRGLCQVNVAMLVGSITCITVSVVDRRDVRSDVLVQDNMRRSCVVLRHRAISAPVVPD